MNRESEARVLLFIYDGLTDSDILAKTNIFSILQHKKNESM